ncbi:MAG TPA: CoA transferase, partial [Steroidobacteraceae bacterium]
IALGPIEPHFYALLLEKLGIDDPIFQQQRDRERWPELRERLAQIFAQRTQAEWCALLEGTDACFAPVLSLTDAPNHHHNRARGTFVEIAGVVQPAPAPRFSETPGRIQSPPPPVGAHNREALADWGFSSAELDALEADGII